jgi:CheY-like chemotaxis protein
VTGSPAEKRRSLATLFAGGSVDIFEAPISQAKRILAARTIDCVVLPLGSGTNVVPFVEWVRGDIAAAHMPIVAHTSAGQPQGVIDKLHQLFVTTVGVADPENALLDTVAQALHRSASDDVSSGDLEPMSELAGRTVAIVDDDIRNIFALTALLEQHHVNVLYAESGREGLSLLAQHTEIDIVLIDIMMPEMDGYETIREIRASPARRHLPLIAVTAKAMADDRERCLEAGASDYLSKPIDTARLLSVLKVWMGTETSQPDCN